MPNHTSNIIRFAAHDKAVLENIKAELRGDDNNLDFNRLVEMPERLRASEDSSTVSQGIAVLTNDLAALTGMLNYQWVKAANVTTIKDLKAFLVERNPRMLELAEKALDNVRDYGHPGWYDWARVNWGTKWNAYDVGDWELCGPIPATHSGYPLNMFGPDGLEPQLYYIQLEFKTAWCFPKPIVERLSALATEKDVYFDHWFSDEGGDDYRYDPRRHEYVMIFNHNVSSELYWDSRACRYRS